MKKVYPTFFNLFSVLLIMLLVPVYAQADHIFYGELNCSSVDTFNGIYKIQLKLKRKCSASQLASSIQITVQNSSSESRNIALELESRTIIKGACAASTSCLNSSTQNYEIITYDGLALLGKNRGMARVTFLAPNSRATSNTTANANENFALMLDINTDIVGNFTHQIDVLTNDILPVSNTYSQEIDIKNATSLDSFSIDFDLPYSSVFPLANTPPVFALPFTGISEAKPLFVSEQQLQISDFSYSFTPTLVHNGWLNFRILHYKKTESNSNFKLASIRNIDHLVQVSVQPIGAELLSIAAPELLKKDSINRWIRCQKNHSDSLQIALLVPKYSISTIPILRWKNDILPSNHLLKSGNLSDTLMLTVWNWDVDHSQLNFVLELNQCQSNLIRKQLIQIPILTFEERIFTLDSITSCGNLGFYLIDLQTTLPLRFQSIGQIVQKTDSSRVFNYSPSITSPIYANHTAISYVCKQSDTLFFMQSTPITDSQIVRNPTCRNYKDGKIKIEVLSGLAPLNVAWYIDGNWINKDSIDSIGSGNYIYKITDKFGCEFNNSANIQNPQGVTWNWQTTSPILCYNDSNAFGNFNITNNIFPNQYLWNDFSHSDSFLQNVAAGNYIGRFLYQNTSGNNCSQDFQVSIPQPDSIDFDTYILHNTCSYSQNGQIAIVPRGGSGFYSYVVNGVSYIQPTISNLANGIYSIKVVDIYGCSSKTKTVEILKPQPIRMNIGVSKPSCKESNNGQIYIASSNGGTGKILFSIRSRTPFLDTNRFTNQSFAPILTIEAKDENNCIFDTSFEFMPIYQLKINLLSLDSLKCYHSKNGTAKLKMLNGLSPFMVNIQNNFEIFGQDTFQINSLSRGFKNLKITDNIGCVFDTVLYIWSPDSIIAKPIILPPVCSYSSDAKIDMEIKGGKTPYSNFSWNGNVTLEPKIENIPSGIYKFFFSDANQCNTEINVNVLAPKPIETKFYTLLMPKCPYDSNGKLAVEIKNGNPPYTAKWFRAGETSPILENITPHQNYSISITDSKGCEKIDSGGIWEVYKHSDRNIRVRNPSCDNSINGALEFTTSIDEINQNLLSFALNNDTFSSRKYYDKLSTGIYTAKVQDKNKCIFDYQISLAPMHSLKVSIPKDTALKVPGENTQIFPKIDSNSNAQIRNFDWTPKTQINCTDCISPVVNPFASSFYYLAVSYGNGCMATDSIWLRVRPIEEIFIPTAFSPNNDKENDCWKVYGEGVEKISVSIWNRLGQIVYTSENIEECWDGMFLGKKCESGVFTAKVWVKYLDGKEKEQYVQVSLLN